MKFHALTGIALAALLPVMSIAAAADAAPRFLTAPLVIPNPNNKAPLVAIVRFTANMPVRTAIEVSDGGRRWAVEFDASSNTATGLPVLGLRPGRRYTIRVSITDAAGNTTRSPVALEFSTPQLPASQLEFPIVQVNKAEPARMEPGYTLLSVRRELHGKAIWRTPLQDRFMRGYGLLVILDNQGEVVWYYQNDSRIAGVARLGNGNILFNLQDFRSVEIDMLGNTVREYYARNRPQGPQPGAVPLEAQSLHHQPHEMPNGNFLIFSANARKVPNFYTDEYNPKAPRRDSMVVGDRVLEVDRQTGKELWSWNTFDHLDVHRVGYQFLDTYWHTRGFPNHADWTHGNGLDYDSSDDSVLVGLKHQDAILKVDRKSGDIRWILGEPTDWGALTSKVLKPVGQPFAWPYHFHNPRLSGKGTIVVFDNGSYGARPFAPYKSPDQVFSRGVEFQVDDKMRTVRQVWASEDKLTADSCNAWAMGDAHRLPKTDNMLVIYSFCIDMRPGTTLNETDTDKIFNGVFPTQGPRIREYTHTSPAELLFDVRMRDPSDVISWTAYGGERIADLYPPAPRAR